MFSTTANERYVCLITEGNEEAYWQLEANREQIEDEIGMSLIWLEPEETRGENMRSQLQLRTDGTLADRDTWEDHIN